MRRRTILALSITGVGLAFLATFAGCGPSPEQSDRTSFDAAASEDVAKKFVNVLLSERWREAATLVSDDLPEADVFGLVRWLEYEHSELTELGMNVRRVRPIDDRTFEFRLKGRNEEVVTLARLEIDITNEAGDHRVARYHYVAERITTLVD